jgi:hexokinase
MNPEKGQYLGVDLGGTTLRIALVKLHKKRITDQINDAFHVPEAVRIGHCVDLFDFIATCLVEFLANQDIIPNGIPLGVVRFH